MRARTFWLVAAAGALLTWGASPGGTGAQSLAPALSGQVIGAEGALRGRAGQRPEGPIADHHHGRQRPRGPLQLPGRQARPRALCPAHPGIGYELDGPQAAEVADGKTANVDLKLRKAADLAAQLTNTEWFMSFPGTAEQKRALIECMSCHTLERIARSKLSADEFMPVLKRMSNYANNTIQARPQRRAVEVEFPEERARKVAEYLATVNLSKARHLVLSAADAAAPERRRHPGGDHRIRPAAQRPSLPMTCAPTRTASSGTRISSRTSWAGSIRRPARHTEFAYPVLKPGFPTGALALEPDRDGNWWLAMMFQAGLAKFDVKTQKFQLFPVQPELNIDTTQESLLTPPNWRVDGKVWTNDVRKQAVLRLDVATGKYEFIDPFKFTPKGRQHSPYGMVSDAANNLYFMDFGDENVGRIDAKTAAATIYPTPTPRSRPRRTMMDEQGRVWFAEFAADKVGMFDPKARKSSRNGTCRRRTPIRMTSSSTGPANCGAATCRATGSCGSIRRAESRSNICCRARPMSGASSSTTAPTRSRCGPATITAPRSSSSSRFLSSTPGTRMFTLHSREHASVG